MAWNIGDEGFEMVLGNYVPHIIDDHIIGALEPLLSRDSSLQGLPYREIEHWGIHPGGRSILDKVQSRLELSDEQLIPARETLRNFGNMSSATVLFVLKHILELPAASDAASDGADDAADDAWAGPGAERICSMAFGPGLTVETALFTRLAAPRSAAVSRQEPAAESAEPAPSVAVRV
jgi:predicted naringenin-chalcone synthase